MYTQRSVIQAISKSHRGRLLPPMRIIPSCASMPLRLTWRQRCLAAGLALAAIPCVRPLLTSAAPAEEGRKIEVLVLGSEGEIHAFDKTTSQVIPELAKEGINCFYSTSPA